MGASFLFILEVIQIIHASFVWILSLYGSKWIVNQPTVGLSPPLFHTTFEIPRLHLHRRDEDKAGPYLLYRHSAFQLCWHALHGEKHQDDCDCIPNFHEYPHSRVSAARIFGKD
jgi:hypothetical protein